MASLDADVAALDARIAVRQRAWFTLEPQSTDELLVERNRLAGALAMLRTRAGSHITGGIGMAAMIESGGAPAPAPAVDGSNAPSIQNKSVKVRTWLIQWPVSGCNAELAHSGSYNGTVKRPSVAPAAFSGGLAKVTAVIDVNETPYSMSINYDATKDTVDVSVTTTHGGRWFAQPNMACTGGTMQNVPRTNPDHFAAAGPAEPPPEEEEPVEITEQTGDGGGSGGGDSGGGCKNVEPYYIDHYWFYPRTGRVEYRYTETKYYCADPM